MNGQDEPRRATPADRQTVISIVSLAFANDPLWRHALARADGTTEHHAKFWAPMIDGALRYPWVWIAAEDQAIATWIPPGKTEMSEDQERQLSDLAREYLGSRADDYFDLLSRFEAAHPHDEPHYYLSLLATHPDHRGKGIGMALLTRNLELIDAEGLPAYLESSNPANNARYESVGFEPVGEFSYPGGSPVVTTMWRSSR
jgi:GNAT superfamily N-acetyltransferase